MTTRLPQDAQRRFHTYVAILIAASSLMLVVVELDPDRLVDSRGGFAWLGYAVILIWAVHIVRSEGQGSALMLVLAQISFWAGLVLVEVWFRVEVTAFDFVTAFGAVMMLGVLAGTLAAESRMVWAVVIASMIAVWSVAVGSVLGESAAVLWVRAIIAVAGVIFTTALVSKLFDQLAYAIVQYERSRRLQDAIARCSEALLVETGAFAVYEAVKVILEATDADYGYVDKTIDAESGNRWEVVADAARRSAGLSHDRRNTTYTKPRSTHALLSAGKAAVVEPSRLEDELRPPDESEGVRSEVSAPIFVGSEFRGSIGLVQFTSDREWHHAEIQTLWRAAHMVSAYWQHKDHADALEASNESKDRLLASVSHEIRTPLTAIVGLSEEIISTGSSLTGDELAELNKIIAAQSRELAELVDDLLVASRADFGNLSIRSEWVDLHAQAEGVLGGLSESYRAGKKIELRGGPCEAWADPLRVRQVIRNLVTNAIKYGGERVVVTVTPNPGVARLAVTDDGPGVPPHETEMIFTRYYRSSESPTQPGSVGIGLAVSRQLTEMMGGTLKYVVEDGEHHFEMVLPAVAPPDTPGSDGSLRRGVVVSTG